MSHRKDALEELWGKFCCMKWSSCDLSLEYKNVRLYRVKTTQLHIENQYVRTTIAIFMLHFLKIMESSSSIICYHTKMITHKKVLVEFSWITFKEVFPILTRRCLYYTILVFMTSVIFWKNCNYNNASLSLSLLPRKKQTTSFLAATINKIWNLSTKHLEIL